MVNALAGLGLLLPGLAWWAWADDAERDPAEVLAVIFGVSAAAAPLLLLGFYLLRVKLTPYWLAGIGAVFLAVLILGLRRRKHPHMDWRWLAVPAIFALMAAWRFWQAHGLVFPNWVDSLHHALIVRKMVEAGGLTATLEPYLPGPFYYHYAFHAVSALFSMLSGAAPADSVLWVGQFMAAAVGLSVYSLVKAASRDWRPAALAALLVTFFTRMPGYYLSWGRYTLLMGCLLLPLAMAEAIRVFRGERQGWRLTGLAILTAGTLLSHYLAALLLALFLLILGLIWLVTSARSKRFQWPVIARLALPAWAGLLMALPWYSRIWRYSADFISTEVSFSAELGGSADQWNYLRYLVGGTSGLVLAAVALAGLVWGLFRKDLRPLACWSALLALLALPLGLQVFSFRSDYFGLVLFIPMAAFAALGLIAAGDWLRTRLPFKATAAIFGALLLAVLIWGAFATRDAVNDDTILADRADRQALEWVNSHLPADARFFVNTTHWGYGMYRGVDGGAWLLPFTGRWTLAPTIFYTYGASPDQAALWADWSLRAAKVDACGQDFWELVAEADLDYIYLREGKGALQPAALSQCAGLTRLYAQGGVSIWLISLPPTSTEGI